MNRNCIETLNTILKISNKGVRKTQILYKANLSHAQLKKYLDFLTDKELLREEQGLVSIYYKTTSKGIEFIEYCDRVQSMLGLEKERTHDYRRSVSL
ncbi:MAG: hypothetical protein QG670_2383 [Thermoproteota archaeon]|nr:hypothetical protein [Thermoproteota archaeon]